MTDKFKGMMKYNKLKQKWLLERIERKMQAEKIMSTVIEKGKPIFKKFALNKVILFGSVLNGRSSETSDVDILVFLLQKDQYWECRHELEQSIGFPIDLYTQDDDIKFVNKIVSRGKVVYEI